MDMFIQSDEFTQMNSKGSEASPPETLSVLLALAQLHQGGRTGCAAKNSVVERQRNGGYGALVRPDMASLPLPVALKRSFPSMNAPSQDHRSPIVLNAGSCTEQHTTKSPPTSPLTGPARVAELPGTPRFVDVPQHLLAPASKKPEPFIKRRRKVGPHPERPRVKEGPAADDFQQGCAVCKLRWQSGLQGFCTACEEREIQVRQTPAWPRSWANFSFFSFQLYSHRNVRANLHLLGQPDTFIARQRKHATSRCRRHPLCPRPDRHTGHCKLKMKQARCIHTSKDSLRCHTRTPVLVVVVPSHKRCIA